MGEMVQRPPEAPRGSIIIGGLAAKLIEDLRLMIETKTAPPLTIAAARLIMDAIEHPSADVRRRAYAEILDRTEGKALQRQFVATVDAPRSVTDLIREARAITRSGTDSAAQLVAPDIENRAIGAVMDVPAAVVPNSPLPSPAVVRSDPTAFEPF